MEQALFFIIANTNRAEAAFEQRSSANVARKARLTERSEWSIPSRDQVWRRLPEPNSAVNICGHIARLGAAELRRAWCAVNQRSSPSCQFSLMNLTVFVLFSDKRTRMKREKKRRDRVEKKKRYNLVRAAEL